MPLRLPDPTSCKINRGHVRSRQRQQQVPSFPAGLGGGDFLLPLEDRVEAKSSTNSLKTDSPSAAAADLEKTHLAQQLDGRDL